MSEESAASEFNFLSPNTTSKEILGSSSADCVIDLDKSGQEIKSTHIIDPLNSSQDVKINIDVDDDTLADVITSENSFANLENKDEVKEPQNLLNSRDVKGHRMQRRKLHVGTVKIKNVNYFKKINKLAKKIQKHSTLGKLQKDLCSNELTHLVSQCKLVHDVSEKENVPETDREETEKVESVSIVSSDSTMNSSLTSQKTLVQIGSSSTTDTFSMQDNKSVIEIKSFEEQLNKSNLMTVGMVVAPVIYKQTETMNQIRTVNINDLTSLTSKPSTTYDKDKYIEEHIEQTIHYDLSDDTLAIMRNVSNCDVSVEKLPHTITNSMISNGDSTFAISSSSNLESKSMNGSESNETLKVEAMENEGVPTSGDVFVVKGEIDSTEPSTSTTFTITDPNNLNDVIVTDIKNFQANINKTTINSNKMKCSLMKDNYNGEAKLTRPKKIDIPNEGTMNELLHENKLKRMFEDALPDTTCEMWKNVHGILDVVVQRLEQTLVNRILEEIKMLNSQRNPLVKTKSFGVLYNEPIIEENQTIQSSHKDDQDKSFQCCLVDNNVLDNLMLKLSMDGPKVIPYKPSELKRLKEPALKGFEILRSPRTKPALEDPLNLTETTLTTTTFSSLASERAPLLKQVFYFVASAGYLIRENIFVIVFIPTFFVLIFLVYIGVALLVKIW